MHRVTDARDIPSEANVQPLLWTDVQLVSNSAFRGPARPSERQATSLRMRLGGFNAGCATNSKRPTRNEFGLDSTA
jgi:hypothetical protein